MRCVRDVCSSCVCTVCLCCVLVLSLCVLCARAVYVLVITNYFYSSFFLHFFFLEYRVRVLCVLCARLECVFDFSILLFFCPDFLIYLFIFARVLCLVYLSILNIFIELTLNDSKHNIKYNVDNIM